MKSLPPLISFLAVLLCASASLRETQAAPQPAANLDAFEKNIAPLLNQYCLDCHGPDKAKAELRVDQLDPDLLTGHDAEHWEEVYNQLHAGEMPPDDEAQPSPAEREQLTAWLNTQLRHAAELKRSTGGNNVLRRLTRYEYNNTLRDLLGIDRDFATNLPPEAAAEEGFVNNSAVLGTSSLHIEYFQAIAADAVRMALALGDQPDLFSLDFEPELHLPKPLAEANDDGKKKKKKPTGPVKNALPADSAVLLSTSSTIEIKTQEIPFEGPIRITVRAAARNTSPTLTPRLHIDLGNDAGSSAQPFKTLAAIDISNKELQDYVFNVRAESFPLKTIDPKKSQFVKVRNAFNPGTAGIRADQFPLLLVDSVRIEGPVHPSWPPETRTRILDVSSKKPGSPAHTRDVLQHFMTRAYRRPPSGDEVTRMLELYQTLRSREASHEDALIDTLSAVLSSPGFLLLAEPAPAHTTPDTPRPLNDYEIASRLSYFLWSTMPDDTLFELAEKGKLSDKKILAAQVKRMLDDPRSKAFSQHFTSQWLNLDAIHSIAINPEFFPKFKEERKDDMTAETVAFFNHLLRENRSALELIDSNEAMLNANLAQHYGIKNVAGDSLRPVKLDPDSKRGGILTHASMLTLNSSGDDTHPIKRGVWLMERILGDPPPPPPPAVPTLAEGDENGERLSLKEKLEVHRQEDACMTCHKRIDPWGLAFENYDGIGVWRDTTPGNEPILADAPDPAEPAEPVSPDGDHYFPQQPAVEAPNLSIPTELSDRALELYKAANESLTSLQRPYNHLRSLGSEGKGDQLRRFLGYIEEREPRVELAFDQLLKETGEDRDQFLKTFRKDNREVLASNTRIRKDTAAIAPPAAAEIAKSKRPRKAPPNQLRGAVDPSTTLANGTDIANLAALKEYLLDEKRDQVAETLVRKTMAYALGRYLDFTDTKTVDTITADFAQNNYRLQHLIESITLSDPFLTK